MHGSVMPTHRRHVVITCCGLCDDHAPPPALSPLRSLVSSRYSGKHHHHHAWVPRETSCHQQGRHHHHGIRSGISSVASFGDLFRVMCHSMVAMVSHDALC